MRVICLKVADRMDKIKPSGTLSMSERARALKRMGRKVYSLAVGEPDFETPENIKKTACEAIQVGFTRYTSSRGIIELREAISEDLEKRGVEANPETEIIVTPGGKHAIYCACLATLNPKDEALVLAPTWPTHFTCVEAAEASGIEVPCGEDYSLDEEGLKEKITRRTKMILINSPNNPTGGVLSPKDLGVIADLAVDHDLLILSDEIYDRIIYEGTEARSMASFQNARERTVVVNGFSKTYAMTGWRLGYAFANKEIVAAMNTVQQATTTCPTNFVQKAGVAALKGPQEAVRKMVQEYGRRRKFIVKGLSEIQGVRCLMPKGAFYAFPDLSSLKMPSSEISSRLLEEQGICTTPGSAFGTCGEGHIRCSYATDLGTISGALEKIKEFVERYADI